jgi:hypothetical protein
MPEWTTRCQKRGPEALIDIFRDYGLIPDDRGEIQSLSASAANLIRSCGYPARAGQAWRCPLLPDEHVRGCPMFEHLSDGDWIVWRWGHGPFDWHPKRAALLPIPRPVDTLGNFDRRVIRRLRKAPGHRLDRRALKRTYWRRGAWFVDRTIDLLIAGDHIIVYGGLLYPFSKAAFRAPLEAQSHPRRPVPVSTIYYGNKGLSRKRAMHELGKRSKNPSCAYAFRKIHVKL